MAEVTYPPLDVPKEIGAGAWIVDSGPLSVAGIPLPIRMTVFRSGDGSLLLSSPTPWTAELQQELERHGPIQHLVAPNIAHWSFMKRWQEQLPQATTWGVPGLRDRPAVKKSGLRLDRDLAEDVPPEWGEGLELVMVPGSAGFREAGIFHKGSRVLALTDLVVNLEPEKLPFWVRPGAAILGSAEPDGKAPVYLRVAVSGRRAEAREAALKMIALNPEKVVFAHGRWFEYDGAARLKKSLRWLTEA